MKKAIVAKREKPARKDFPVLPDVESLIWHSMLTVNWSYIIRMEPLRILALFPQAVEAANLAEQMSLKNLKY